MVANNQKSNLNRIIIVLLIVTVLVLVAKLDDKKRDVSRSQESPTVAQTQHETPKKSIAQSAAEMGKSLEEFRAAKAELRKSWADVKSEFRKGLRESLEASDCSDGAKDESNRTDTAAKKMATITTVSQGETDERRLVRETVENGRREGKTDDEMAVDLVMKAAAQGVAKGLVDIAKQGFKDIGVTSADVKDTVEAYKKVTSFKDDVLNAAKEEIKAEIKRAAQSD